MMNSDINIISEVDEIKIVNAISCDVDDVMESLQIKEKDFIIVTQNIRSVYCNFNDLLITLSQLKFSPTIIILTECWLCDHKQIPMIPDYTCYFSSRHLNKSDGVITYIKDTHNAKVSEIYIQDASSLQIQINNKTILAIYRSPSITNIDGFINSLDSHLETLKTHTHIFITGDININTLPREGEQSSDLKNRSNYLDMLGTHGISMGHNLPTRQLNSLDHIMLKIDKNKIKAQIGVLNTTITDHAMVLLHLSGSPVKYKCTKTKSVTDYKNALYDLRNKKLNELLLCNDPDLVTENLINTVSESLKENTKEVHISKNKRIIKPWITPGVLRCIRNRNRMQQRLRCNPDDEILLLSFRRYRNYCNKLVKKLKRDYERQLLRDSTGNSKNLWNNIAKIIHTKQIKSETSKLINIKTSEYESANLVNKYFGNIGKNLADAISKPTVAQSINRISTPTQISSFVLLETDIDEVQSVLMSLKTNSAPGHDKIPTSFLKLAKFEVVPIITHLANLCFNKGIFPSLLKESLVTPIFKNGDEADVNNYRPISVLPSISKILEKLINKRLLNYIDKYDIFSKSQFGFRRGMSTEDAVAELTSVVAEGLDSKRKCLAVFLDLKKAFDTVSHSILLQKLEYLGVRGIPLELLKSYVNGRTQRVKLGKTVSELDGINCGVPQGSVLGPTLFLIYINDLCNMNIPHTKILSYADDTAVVFTGESWDDVKSQAEHGLSRIAEWLNLNLLTLNTTKTNFMCFSIQDKYQPDSSFQIKIHLCDCTSNLNCTCPIINKVQKTKYLGVMIDQKLNWHSHIDLVSSRLRKLIWIFKDLRHIVDKKLLNEIYVALAQSIIVYCITLWGGALKTKFLEVERAQRALLKVMYFKKRRFPTQSLYLYADLLSVRKLYVICAVLKKHKSLGFFPDQEMRRRKDKVVQIPFVHTRFAQNQFSHLAPQIYNKINKKLNIYSMTLRDCKSELIKWLKCLDYNEIETFIKL